MDLLDQADLGMDSLSALEDRLVQTATLVTRLRRERDAAVAERNAAQSALERTVGDSSRAQLLEKRATDAEAEAARFRSAFQEVKEELESMRAERKQVRVRIEKLLTQIDQLSGA